MPLWIGAYLADTMRLTTVQHGAYLLLLMAYWRERAPLPDDDEELRSITKTDKAEWKRMRPVLAKFFKVEGGVWWHKRVEQEMAEADTRSKAASGKAQAAANARWGAKAKDAAGNAPSMPQALPEDLHKECPTPLPSSVPNGTGAEAPKTPAEMTKDELWKVGKSLLAEQGTPVKQCGSIVGKLCKDYGDEVVISAIRTAVVERPADALTFIKAICMRHTGQRTGTKSTTTARRIETLAGLTGGSNTTGENNGFIEAEARVIA